MLKKYTILATIAMVSASLQLSASSSVLNIEVDSGNSTFSGAFSGGYINKTGSGEAILSGDSSVGTALLGVQISGGTLSISEPKNIGGSLATVEFTGGGNGTLNITNSMTLASVKKTSLGTLNLNANTLNITTFDSSGTGEIDVNNGILICPLMSGTYGISSGATLQPISTGCNNASILNIAGTLDCSSLTDLTAQLPGTLNFYNGSKLKINGGLTFGKNINIQALS